MNTGVVLEVLIGCAEGKARQDGKGLDGVADEVARARATVRDVVLGKLAGNAAVGDFENEVTETGEVSDRTRQRITDAVNRAAEDDAGFAAELNAAIGDVLWHARRSGEAITAYQQARDIFRELGDLDGEGMAWNGLGLALVDVRRFGEAVAAYQHVIDIYRSTGNPGEGTAWISRGLALAEMRLFDEAVTAYRHAIDVHRAAGDRNGEGMAWNNLGLAQMEMRLFDEATAAYRHAINIHRATSDRNSEGMAWNNLGAVLGKKWELDDAMVALQHARDMLRESDDCPEASILRTQLESARVLRNWPPLGSPSIDLEVAAVAPTIQDEARVLAVDAHVHDERGGYVGELIVWMEHGRLAALEYAWVTDEMPTSLPDVAALRISPRSGQ